MPLESGQDLLHYRLVEKIGEGGMGLVWKAVDTTLDREVAVKILPDAFAADPDRVSRFEREAKLLASLNHPNIATIHGFHQLSGVMFLAMELVEGQDLAQKTRRRARCRWSRRCGFASTDRRRACRRPTTTASSTATSSRRTCG